MSTPSEPLMEALVKEFSDLPGTVTVQTSDSHADFFIRNRVAVIVEHEVRPDHRLGGWAVVPRSMLDESPPYLAAFIGQQVDRHLRPWKYPDAAMLPRFSLFPVLSRIAGALRRS